MTIASDAQRLEQDARVTLFLIDASSKGQGELRFAPESSDGQSLFFDGYEYTPLPMDASGFEWNGKGKLPRPKLSVSGLSVSFLSLSIGADDLVGLPIQRIRTYRKHLDDGADPDPEQVFPIDYYVFERKSRDTRTSLEFELSVKMDQQSRRIPARQVLRDSCTHIYRRWTGNGFDYSRATCPYAGGQSYDAAGNAVSDSKDRCGKRLSDCRLRFGDNGRLPTRAFPGVGRVR